MECFAALAESGGRGPMTHFFEKRDFRGQRLSLWLVVLMAFVTPVCWWSVRQLRIENDVESWLPEKDPERRALHWAQEQFSVEERILLTWDGSSINDDRIVKLVEQLVGKPDQHGNKRGGLPYISSVIEPRQSLSTMQENGIEPQEAARRLEGTILGAGPLRLQLTESGRSALKKTKRELQTALRTRYGVELTIQDPSPDLTSLVSIPAPREAVETGTEPSPPAILSADGTFAEEESLEHDLQVTWRGMRVGSDQTVEIARWLTEYVPERGEGKPLVERSFFAVGSPVALAIGISEAGLADKTETISAIRAASKLAGIPPESLHLSGSVVATENLNAEVARAAWDTSFPLVRIHHRSVILTSVLVSALLAYLLVRRIRLVTLLLLASLFTTFCAVACIPPTGGAMNLVSLVMPTLIFVLAISRGIRVANTWQHELIQKESAAKQERARFSWIPCGLASLATTIGLISLCTSGLAPVREFGLYAACGTVISFVVVVLTLPTFIPFWTGPKPPAQETEHSGWRWFGQILGIRPGLQALLLIAVYIGCSLGLPRLTVEPKMIRYFSDRARITQDYWFIETNLSGAIPVETVIRFDEQSQKDTSFLDRMELIRRIQKTMWTHPEISGTASLADFQPVSEQPPDDAGFLQKTKHNKKATLIQQRIRDGEVAAAKSYYTIAEKGHDLLEPGDVKLNHPGDELWRITANVNVMTDNDSSKILADLHEIVQQELKLYPGSHHSIAGTVPMLVSTQKAVLKTLSSSFGITLALIVVMLTIRFRSLWPAFIAMIPNVLPIAVVFGSYAWLHQRMDIVSLMTASIGLGIAVDGTLQFLTAFQQSMKNGKTRGDAVTASLAQCGPSLFQSTATITIGLLVLVPSEFRFLSHFGGLLAAISAVSFLSNSVLLPQLVGSPLGVFFEPRTQANVPSVRLDEPEKTQLDSAPSAASSDEGKGPPAPHIKPIDPNRKKRRPTA